jgi:hypothetical protein
MGPALGMIRSVFLKFAVSEKESLSQTAFQRNGNFN